MTDAEARVSEMAKIGIIVTTYPHDFGVILNGERKFGKRVAFCSRLITAHELADTPDIDKLLLLRLDEIEKTLEHAPQ